MTLFSSLNAKELPYGGESSFKQWWGEETCWRRIERVKGDDDERRKRGVIQ